MRVKKHKHTRRAILFYKINYNFHEPFKVLLDGNFIHATASSNLGDLAAHLPRLLGCKCKLFVTRCVTQELRSMGADFKESANAARSFELHKCGHEGSDAVPAAQCIAEQIGKANSDHWWVATQDKALRQGLGEIPGTPVVFATVNGLHLETPSEMARSTAKEAEDGSMALPEHERRSAALKDLEKLRPKLHTNVRFRRNFAKGPNPLAAKKKVKKPAGGQQQQQVVPGGGSGGAATGGVAAAKATGGADKRKRKRGTGGGTGGGGEGGSKPQQQKQQGGKAVDATAS